MSRYVAILDTGGISYSGRVFVAVAETEDAARDAAAGKFLGQHHGIVITRYNDRLTTVDAVADYYGIRTYGPIEDGAAVEGD